MKKFIYKSLLLWVGVLSGHLNAQSFFDVVNLGYEHTEYSLENASDFSFDRFQGRINPGVELKNGDYILGTFSGEIFKFQNIEYGGEELELYSNFISAGYLHFWKDKEWSLLTQVRFKLNSDYYKLELGDIQTGGWFMFSHDQSEVLKLFAGMYFNQEVDKNLLFPIGGIHWLPNDKWNLYILIPSLLRFEWMLKKNNWYTGLESDWNLNSYLIKENPEIHYFRMETLVTSLFIEKHISEKLVLYAKIGNYQINDYEAFDNSDELIPQSQLESGLIKNLSFKAGVAYRMRL
ncbi:MAG: DUF6268 family outer membrane beta-barrel protein [Christiangramia sp.]|nr:DUF6268 family outer membrane beta-barrel protein [Christiangramia sp.]